MSVFRTSGRRQRSIAILIGVAFIAGVLILVNEQDESKVLAGQAFVIDGDTLLLDDGRFHNSIWVQAKLSFWTVILQLLLQLRLQPKAS